MDTPNVFSLPLHATIFSFYFWLVPKDVKNTTS